MHHFLDGPAHYCFNGLPNGYVRWPYVWLPRLHLISLLAKWHPQVPLAPFEETQLAPQLGFVGVGSFPLFPYYPRPCPGPLA